MAILKKRRAKDAPAATQTGKQTTAQTPAERLTSAIKGEAVTTPRLGGRSTVTPARVATSAKPAITQPGGATSITNRVSGATRPTVTTTQGSAGSTSGLTNAITGALSGAAIGVGAKAVYDKLTGTKKVVPASTPSSGGTRGGSTAGGSGIDFRLPTGSGSNIGLKMPGKQTGTSGTGLKMPSGSGTGLKLPGVSTPPFNPNATKGGTTGSKTGTGASGFPINQGSKVKPGTGASGFPVRDDEDTSTGTGASGFPVSVDDEGNSTYTYDDGSTITLDADGNVIGSTDAVDMNYGFSDGQATVNDDGSTTYTYEDGSTTTIGADGTVISYTEAVDTGSGGYGFPVDDSLYGEVNNDSSDYTSGYGGVNNESSDYTSEYGYYQDEDGNIYDTNGELMYAASDYSSDYSDDEYGYYDDYYNDLYADSNYGDDSYNWDDSYYDDTYAYNEEDYYYPEEDYAYLDDDYYEEDGYWAKKGGLVALMKKGGGVRRFEDGGYSDTGEEVQDWQNVDYNYGERDITGDMAGMYALNYGATPDNRYFKAVSPSVPLEPVSLSSSQMASTSAGMDDVGSDVEFFDDGSYIVYYSDGSSVTYDSTGSVYQYSANGVQNSQAERLMDRDTADTSTASGDDYSRYSVGNIQYFDDGSYIQTFDDGSTLTVDSDGNVAGSTPATDYDITGAGSGSGRTNYYNRETPADRARAALETQQRETSQKGALDKIMESISGSGYLGAGAAGAVLGALLGNSDLFSGGTGTQNKGIDMSKVGVIPARTTDFGVGPANYVTYDQYAARDQMPDIYGEELYRNLNAPGFNPVTEGEYGVEESPDAAAVPQAAQPATQMADGGLAGSYFTFGKPVDPLTNLTRPMPATAPQMGGLPQATPQTPPQAAMQQGMKSGGLPAVSNVPLAEGRLDFRQGSAVHGPGDGQSDDIPAMLADGEYVIDAETVAQIGNGSTKAGAKALDEFRQNIRKHKRSAPLDKIPPKTKTLTSYLKKGK
jgi:hypothetical protein